ncbi:DUF2306 domain-containing protein [Brevibacillus fluminis]|uniref:DUF2306 domain-containing protein n=1 Tax=Brevibacillus fluminis TaxID=511487 RepID=A0A3M8DI03_9BACL|nr:DUF2306 domain-containing protein [Brevibacillus fluminis]RNB87229.1 DUF2306 domain-containing protein [Brevibacillus fluminis]
MERKKGTIGKILLIAVIVIVGLVAAAPYATLDPALSRIKLDPGYPLHYPLLVIHIFTALIALLTGPFQFSERLRQTRMSLHRLLGKVYLATILISSVTGLAVAFHDASFTKQMAFVTLSALWLLTAWRGYQTIRKGDVAGHRVWMMRSYGITLVAVTARLVVPVCILFYLAAKGLPGTDGIAQMIDAILQVNIWLGIILNMVILEWSLIRKANR